MVAMQGQLHGEKGEKGEKDEKGEESATLAAITRGDKRAYVRSMFAAVAPRYDFLNHLLSFNQDRRWRRVTVGQLGWERAPGGRYLDLCAGTLDLAASLANLPGFTGRVFGADFVHAMLVRGQGKSARVVPLTADAQVLPFLDATFDGAMVGFGVRNLADLDAGLAEAARVVKPGGRLAILEFSMPSRQPLRALLLAYFRRILPVVGRLVSKHRTAYTYLPESVLLFPDAEGLAKRMIAAGFGGVSYRRMTGGICAVHVGTRREGREGREGES